MHRVYGQCVGITACRCGTCWVHPTTCWTEDVVRKHGDISYQSVPSLFLIWCPPSLAVKLAVSCNYSDEDLHFRIPTNPQRKMSLGMTDPYSIIRGKQCGTLYLLRLNRNFEGKPQLSLHKYNSIRVSVVYDAPFSLEEESGIPSSSSKWKTQEIVATI